MGRRCDGQERLLRAEKEAQMGNIKSSGTLFDRPKDEKFFDGSGPRKKKKLPRVTSKTATTGDNEEGDEDGQAATEPDQP